MTDEPERERSTQTLFQREAALVKLAKDAKIVSWENIKTVARILGPKSAAAGALKRAEEHGGRVRFWYSAEMGMLAVELLKETLH